MESLSKKSRDLLLETQVLDSVVGFHTLSCTDAIQSAIVRGLGWPREGMRPPCSEQVT